MLQPIQLLNGASQINGTTPSTNGNTSGSSFEDTLRSALDQVESLQQQSDNSIELAGAGAGPDVHTVMIQMEKAKLSLDLTVQVRNKVIDAYQEIMRMQM